MRLIITLIITLIFAFVSGPAAAEDQGFFACLHLAPEQVQWFKEPGISSCCALADGMPTRYEEREDGTYVPPFSEAYAQASACREDKLWEDKPGSTDHWVRLPAEKVKRRINPIGVAIIWWTNARSGSSAMYHEPVCFIGEARS